MDSQRPQPRHPIVEHLLFAQTVGLREKSTCPELLYSCWLPNPKYLRWQLLRVIIKHHRFRWQRKCHSESSVFHTCGTIVMLELVQQGRQARCAIEWTTLSRLTRGLSLHESLLRYTGLCVCLLSCDVKWNVLVWFNVYTEWIHHIRGKNVFGTKCTNRRPIRWIRGDGLILFYFVLCFKGEILKNIN